MPKKPKARPPIDENSAAHNAILRMVARTDPDPVADPVDPGPAAARERGKNPAAVALGRLGGLKGGKARAAKLSPERRKEIAIAANRKRHGK